MMACKKYLVEKAGARCFCNLPVELLLMILGHLSVLDLLSFRAVCKCWRSAFLNCPMLTLQNQAHGRLPWFLILRAQEHKWRCVSFSVPRPLLFTTGKLGDLSTRRVYTTDIPELHGTRFLLSKYGWLLLFSSEGSSQSLFFFNPFSTARIELPFMDVSKLCCPVFDISAPPTSPGCLLFLICCGVPTWKFRICLCSPREPAWTTEVYGEKPVWTTEDEEKDDDYFHGPGPVINAVFVDGFWYCLHKVGYFSTYDDVRRSWKLLGQPESEIINYDIVARVRTVSYVVKHDRQMFMLVHNTSWYAIALRDPLEIVYHNHCLDKQEFLFRNDVESAIKQLENSLEVDSFNLDAWCGVCDSDGVSTFRWHHFTSSVENYFPLKEESCFKGNECSSIIIWIEPMWIHRSPNLSWSI